MTPPSSLQPSIFGELPVTPEEIIRALAADTPKAAKRIGSERNLSEKGNTVWTLAVKEVLTSLAEKHKGQTFCSSQEPKKSEFLLDVVWWEDSECGSRAVLGCESEWGNPRNLKSRPSDIAYDFEKLLSFKSPVKLLVFEAADSDRKKIHDEIRKHGSNFTQHVTGEYYLFVEFSGAKCDSHIYRVRSNGKLPDFNPFPPMAR